MKKQMEIMQENFNPERGVAVKPRLQQYFELLLFKATRMYSPSEYYLYRFNRKDKTFKVMLDYLSARDFDRFCRPVFNNPAWGLLLENKWLTHLHLSRLGFPTTKVMGLFKMPNGTTVEGDPLAKPADVMEMLYKKRPSSLVVKPVAGGRGMFISVFSRLEYAQDDIYGITPSGIKKSLSALLNDKEQQAVSFPIRGTKSFCRGWLLEECLEPHGFFQKICPYSIPSLRIVTFVDPGGEAEVLFASVRLSRKGTDVSNVEQGAVVANIDIATGALSVGRVKPQYGFAEHNVHPDSNVLFAGETVPMWPQVIETAKQAALATPGHRSVGWDIALTPTGPVIIEGNQHWALPSNQVATGQGLLTPQRRQQLKEMGLEFPAGGVSALLGKRLLRLK